MNQITLTQNDRKIIQLASDALKQDILKTLGNGDKKTLASVWDCPQDINFPLTQTEIKSLSSLMKEYTKDLINRLEPVIHDIYSGKSSFQKEPKEPEMSKMSVPKQLKKQRVEIERNTNGYFAYSIAKDEYLHNDGMWRSGIKYNGIKSGYFSNSDEIKDLLREQGLEYRLV